jgi:two-component system, OmpR family, response regulator
MNILLIEDDKLTLNLLQYCIEKLGHKAFLAEDGEEAIKMITDKDFDLLICDIMMPGISGLSLVSVLRTVHLCTMPIIMMSSINNKPLLDAAFEAGANDFIAKPFAMDDLSEKLKKYDKAEQQK